MVNEQRTTADGKPIYWPGRAPQGLATRNQLSGRGLKPGSPPVAYLAMDEVLAELFDERNVIPLGDDRIRIEMDGATAAALYNSLYGWGEHVAAGAPPPEFTPEDNSRLARVIDDLGWHLGRHRRSNPGHTGN